MRSLLIWLRSSGLLPMLVMPVLCAATMSWGADSHGAGFLYASGIFALAVLVLLIGGGPPFPVGLVIGFMILSIYLVATNSGSLHVEYATLWAGGAVFICGRAVGGLSRVPVRRAWIACLSLATLYALWALAQALTVQAAAIRLEGSFLSANTAATLLGMIAILAVAELRRIRLAEMIRQRRDDKATPLSGLIALAAALFAMTGVCLSGSRAGAILCVLTVIGMICWTQDARKPVTLVVLGLLAIVAVISGGMVADRFSSVESAWQVRMDHFRAYAQAIASKPLLGHGLGQFEQAVASVMAPHNALFLQKQGAAHNILLQWLLQAGLIGSIMMWTLIGAIVKEIWSALSHIRAHRRILRGCLCVCAFVLAHGMVDYALEIPGVMWWWAWTLGFAHGVAIRSPYKKAHLTREAGGGSMAFHSWRR